MAGAESVSRQLRRSISRARSLASIEGGLLRGLGYHLAEQNIDEETGKAIAAFMDRLVRVVDDLERSIEDAQQLLARWDPDLEDTAVRPPKK